MHGEQIRVQNHSIILVKFDTAVYNRSSTKLAEFEFIGDEDLFARNFSVPAKVHRQRYHLGGREMK